MRVHSSTVRLGLVVMFLGAAGCGLAEQATPSRGGVDPGAAGPFSNLALPSAFEQRVRDRAIIDGYQDRHHRVAPAQGPAIVGSRPARRQVAQAVQVVHCLAAVYPAVPLAEGPAVP